jgi:nitroreductase
MKCLACCGVFISFNSLKRAWYYAKCTILIFNSDINEHFMTPVESQIKKHCSVRRFTDAAIERELLHRLIECGQMASSSSFIQAYSIIRVTDTDHRQQIAAAAGGQGWVESAAEFLMICADLTRVEHCCALSGDGNLKGYTEHFIAATVDAALVAQNILLAAESNDLGGVFIGGIRNDPQLVADLLKLPKQVYPVFGLCLGYPSQAGQHKPRLPVSSILHEGSYRVDDMMDEIQEYDDKMTEYYATRNSNRRHSNWTQQTAKSVQGKRREHMLTFLQKQGLLNL